MYNKLTASSQAKLATCHPDLQRLINEVLKHVAIVVTCGYRSPEAQQELFDKGYSKLDAGQSKHNISPSHAVDLAPGPVINWEETRRFYFLAGIVKTCAANLGIKVRGGYDWDSDNDFNDQSFNDLGHFELI